MHERMHDVQRLDIAKATFREGLELGYRIALTGLYMAGWIADDDPDKPFREDSEWRESDHTEAINAVADFRDPRPVVIGLTAALVELAEEWPSYSDAYAAILRLRDGLHQDHPDTPA